MRYHIRATAENRDAILASVALSEYAVNQYMLSGLEAIEFDHGR